MGQISAVCAASLAERQVCDRFLEAAGEAGLALSSKNPMTFLPFRSLFNLNINNYLPA